MTEEKFTKLSEEDLNLVAGGTEYNDVFVTKQKDGTYLCIKTYLDGNAADYKALVACIEKGETPMFIGKHCSCFRVTMKPDHYAKKIASWKSEGYNIHVK